MVLRISNKTLSVSVCLLVATALDKMHLLHCPLMKAESSSGLIEVLHQKQKDERDSYFRKNGSLLLTLTSIHSVIALLSASMRELTSSLRCLVVVTRVGVSKNL